MWENRHAMAAAPSNFAELSAQITCGYLWQDRVSTK